MRPYVPPSTRPFSVNLYLGRIRVMVGGVGGVGAGASCSTHAQGQEKDTYLWAGYLEKNMRGRTEADLLCSLLRTLNAQQKKILQHHSRPTTACSSHVRSVRRD